MINYNHPQVLCSFIASCQKDIDQLFCRSTLWGLKLSLDNNKCCVIRCSSSSPFSAVDFQYYVNNDQIQFTEYGKALGRLIEKNLKFHQCILSVVSKSGSVATNFLRSTVSRSPVFMKSLFITPTVKWGK